MARFLFFVLLIACIAFGVQIALTQSSAPPDFSRRERNAAEVHIVAVTPPDAAARAAQETRAAVKSLAGAACVEFSGFNATYLARARQSFGALQLGDRFTERRIEDVTRYWVFVPPFMPHVECNLSRTRPLVWMTTRTPENIVVNLADVDDADLRDWLDR